MDLSTTDPADAKRFYGELFGWKLDDTPVGDGVVYTMCSLGGKAVCAISQLRDEERRQGVPPHWNNYVTTDDVDARAAQVRELGGAVLADSFDVMQAGRMAVAADPAGGVFCMWQPRESIGAEVVNVPGALTWNELATKDFAGAKRFYGDLFGWRFDDIEGSPVPYSVIYNGERTNGGVREQTEMEAEVPPNWFPYFATDGVDAPLGRIAELGGDVIMPATEVPAGRFAVAADPQRAVFALFEGEFDD